MVRKIYQLNETILHLPIVDISEEEKRYIRIVDLDSGKQFAEFRIGLAAENADFYCPLYLNELAGHVVELSCKDESAPDDLFDSIIVGGEMEERTDLYPDLYREEGRQQVHFSPKRGWLNDPNGLVYVNGEFHMNYQHNPYGPTHGAVNLSWGFAVSRDGVHFKEYPDVIRPWDMQTSIASGSAIVDENNLSGYGKGTVLAAYTALANRIFDERKPVGTRGQMLMYSTDGGYSFQYFEKNPIIPSSPTQGWRDPKILSMEDGSLCIAVYEKYEGKNCVSFYSSNDCVNWTFRSRTMDLYECPDLFEMTAAESGEKKWILYGGNGMYRVGTFENYAFTQIGESHYLDYGSATYAGQTFNSHPDKDSRYHMAWMRDLSQSWHYNPDDEKHGLAFSQSMSLICRFTFHDTKLGYRLFRVPIEAFSALRKKEAKVMEGSVGDRDEYDRKACVIPLEVPGDAEITIDAQRFVCLLVNGSGFTYYPDTGILQFTSQKEYRLTTKGVFRVRIVTDAKSIEFFICDEISATFSNVEKEKALTIESEAASWKCSLWQLESIWKK